MSDIISQAEFAVNFSKVAQDRSKDPDKIYDASKYLPLKIYDERGVLAIVIVRWSFRFTKNTLGGITYTNCAMTMGVDGYRKFVSQAIDWGCKMHDVSGTMFRQISFGGFNFLCGTGIGYGGDRGLTVKEFDALTAIDFYGTGQGTSVRC
jgi:hypothetical protein